MGVAAIDAVTVEHGILARQVHAAMGTGHHLQGIGALGRSPALAALYFQYSRYLLIASSRPGTQPANLQGIWSHEIRPPWSANWTANINAQMNYWHAETCNLAECHEPLFDLIAGIARNGTATARVNYGLPGWVSHHNVDLWRQSAPVGEGSGSPTWANWQMSGAWFCAHLWERWLFSGDREFLRRRAYPLMKGAAEFCLAWLIEGKDGHLTTCPSFSTENSFRSPATGKPAQTGAGCTMDIALIAEFATRVNETTENIGARRLHTVMERLLDEISFDGPALAGQSITIDAAYVRRMLADIVRNEDLSRYIL